MMSEEEGEAWGKALTSVLSGHPHTADATDPAC